MRKWIVCSVVVIGVAVTVSDLHADDTWVGWNLGSLSIGYDLFQGSELYRVDLGEFIWYDEDKRLGFTINPLEFTFTDDSSEEYVSIPIELRYSIFRKYEIGGVEVYGHTAIRIDDSVGDLSFECGVRIGTTFRSERSKWWYSPSFSISQAVTTGSDFVSTAELDLGFLFYVIGLANMALAQESYQEDYAAD